MNQFINSANLVLKQEPTADLNRIVNFIEKKTEEFVLALGKYFD